jgi:hypothetical protein
MVPTSLLLGLACIFFVAGWVWPVLADVVVAVIEGLACAVVVNASLMFGTMATAGGWC